MLSRIQFVLGIVALSALFIVAGSVQADFITVANSSFESPDVSTAKWQPMPQIVDLSASVGAWAEDTTNSGVLYNDGTYRGGNTHTNVDGNQIAVVDSGVSRQIWQDMTTNYEAGKSYTLTVAMARSPGYDGQDGDKCELRLFYRNQAGQQVTIGTPTQITRSALDPVELVDYSTTISGVQAGDAWAGKAIGISVYSTVLAGPTNGCWSIDNVRLSWDNAPTPEPSAIVILATGLIGLLAYAWRKRR
jgi:hypothetical protein